MWLCQKKTYFEIDEKEDWLIVESFLERAKKFEKPEVKIKALFVDCDGVLTDGGMYYSESGDEFKKFNAKDGMGFSLIKKENIITGIITGETRDLVKRRFEKLKLDELHMGIQDKLKIVLGLMEKYNLKPEEIAYIGDDINDLEVMKLVGLPCTVSDSMESIKKISKFITKAKGGDGAVREVVEHILKKLK